MQKSDLQELHLDTEKAATHCTHYTNSTFELGDTGRCVLWGSSRMSDAMSGRLDSPSDVSYHVGWLQILGPLPRNPEFYWNSFLKSKVKVLLNSELKPVPDV